MDINSLQIQADLARVEESPRCDLLRDLFDVYVRKDNSRIIATAVTKSKQVLQA
jgi:hypothetical protein